MNMSRTYPATEPTRAAVEALEEPTVLEFGASWCGHCQAAQPLLAKAFARHPEIRHIKIEDGKGRPLGRSFRVTLWPTLIFLDQGKEVARLVRPTDSSAIERALARISLAA
ncbi:thioredoxin family protein [Pseudomonas indica]|uniref:Thioredoxin 1 n=1 Tax=Pseudomonas indica TaxID=137658 RepID=A0A1G9LQU8_9PSED|nr:thioredoxin family protein [Pseudomonas indica]MBU3058805.1 thioredoxin family protein [Pseudomonas indica]PAU54542.1 thiol reductase thioredoxin [Pseudomonas indica]SDL64323.1 thioredoxin 1 [Pseudomonas indica]